MMQFSHSPLEDWARATLLIATQQTMSKITVATKKSIRLHGLSKSNGVSVWEIHNSSRLFAHSF